MGAAVETLPQRAVGVRSSQLKRPITLRYRDSRVMVEPDGAVRAFESLSERRSLFGYEQLWFYKIQANVVVQGQRPDWSVRVTPRSAQYAGRVLDFEVVQSIEFFSGSSSGYLRRVRLRNAGSSPARLRILNLLDPTAAQLGDAQKGWGSLGVNAFNRGSHVALDEVSDPPSARVVGSLPSPSKFYMSTDRSRVQDLVSLGELPDATAGMSGQVMVVSSHDIDFAAGESKDVTFVSIYNSARLEEALSDFGRLQDQKGAQAPRPVSLFFSDQALTESASWALSALEGAQHQRDTLDKVETLRGLTYVDPQAVRSIVESFRKSLRKEGSLPHSLDPGRPGTLESSVLLREVCYQLLLAQDKKVTRGLYPMVKQLAGYLMASSKDYTVLNDPTLPQGWRRGARTGFPSGEVPEVTLAAAEALLWASRVARSLTKGDDAGKFRERSEMVMDRMKKKLVDERGFTYLSVDASGKARTDETIDMAVTAFRSISIASLGQAAAHRLLEKDFETPYGPRVVPTSNRLYFNRTYGRGQLGGFWTRSALAHAIVCYRSGFPGIGGLEVLKVAKLVAEDSTKLGASPGDFPLWVDPEGQEAHGDESDPVSAARFVEALIEGEIGLSSNGDRTTISPPAASSIRWVLASTVWAGEPASFFVGRGDGKSHTFYNASRVESRSGTRFGKADPAWQVARGVYAINFYSPGQVICLGNSSPSPAKATVTFPPRAADLTKKLSAPLEVYDQAKGSWFQVGTIRVTPTMSFEVQLSPEEWKAYRVSASG